MPVNSGSRKAFNKDRMDKLTKILKFIKSATKGSLLIAKRTLLPTDRDLTVDKPWLKFYPPAVSAQIEIPALTLNHYLEQAVEQNGKGTAIIYFGRKISYHHFYTAVLHFAAGLQKLNVKKGDRVALILPNVPQFLIAYWAAMRLGAVVVLINPLLSEREMQYQLQATDTQIAIVLDRIYPRIAKVEKLSPLKHVVIVCIETYMHPLFTFAFQFKNQLQKREEKIHLGPETIYFRRLLKPHPVLDMPDLNPDEPAVLLFTSAVTGAPKGAMLSHRNLVANTLQARAWMPDMELRKEVFMAVLPFIHSYGMTACHHLAILCQAAMVLEPRFDIKRIINDIRRYNVTVFPGVPTMYTAINNQYARRSVNLKCVRFCVCGGAPLSAKTRIEFEEITGGHLAEGYGLTEASPITHCNPLSGLNKDGSIGIPWPNTEARIIDIKTGIPLPPLAIGELQVRGPQVMIGYWRDPEATRTAITEDGWLNTGDIGCYDKDGYFYLLDRKKDIIFSGAYNIYPAEVERVLLEHPAVAEVAVVGVTDPYYGERVKAVVILKEGQLLFARDLVEFCHGKIAKFKIPKEIEFVEHLPKNFLGKVLRRVLKPSGL
jgi:long-chain acyl-CoA synthetase